MKIWEVISEDLQAGAGNVTVGTGGAETFQMKAPERENIPQRRVQRPPQPGYSIKVGNKVIPAPLDQADNEMGVVNSVLGG